MNAEALALARELEDTSGIADALYQEGCTANRLGDLARAQSLLEEALRVRRLTGPLVQELYDLLELGATAQEQSDHARAGSLGEEALALARRLDHIRSYPSCLWLLGRVAVSRGDHTAGRALLEESMAVYRKHVDWEGMGMGLRALGDLFLEQADVSAAMRVFGESLALSQQSGDKLDLARSLEGLVGVWVEAQPFVAAGLADNPSDRLSAREREVVRLVARGCTNRQIAEQLVIAARTADTHVGHVLTKLNIHWRAELAAWAVEHGLTATDRSALTLRRP